METVNKKEIWLIGNVAQFRSIGLPTFRDILKNFFYLRIAELKDKDSAIVGVAKELKARWANLENHSVEQRDVVRRIKKVIDLYESVKKSKHRRTPVQLSYENRLKSSLDNVFDIAPKANYHHKKQCNNVEALNSTSTERIRIESSDNAGDGLSVTSTDRSSAEAIEDINVEVDHQNELHESTSFEDINYTSTERNVMDIVDRELETDSKDDGDFETSLSVYYKSLFACDLDVTHDPHDANTQRDVIYKIINSPDVTSALDRTNTSNGSFVIILAAIGRALEVDLTECVFSTSTLLRRREAHREIITTAVKNEFLSSINSGLVVHWDGKRLKDYTNENSDERNQKIDRIAIVVTGLNIQKIIAIAKTDDGSGVVVSDTVHEHLAAWTILPKIVAMCTDTTTANTGGIKGACVLFEKIIKRNLIYLACRHHMLELIIGAIFILLFGETTSPTTEMFENFKRDWCQIDKSSFEPLNMKIFKTKYLKELREDVITYIENILKTKDKKFIPRGDYLEMMELCLLVLGQPRPNYTFKVPHNCSNARWMGKVIYCLKMFLFREQINFDGNQLADLEQFCIFACLIYTKSWIQSCVPSNAPINDLELLKSMRRFARFNSKIANCAIEKFQDHLWYLGSELVVLSLFSNKINTQMKCLMFARMKHLDNGQWTQRDRKLVFDKKIFNKELCDLVGPSSMTVLKSLQIDVDFMFQNDVDQWEQLSEYRKAKEIVDSFKVVNDTAERALKMMTDFNQSLTSNEFEKQSAIQVIEDNRQRIPNLKKHVLSNYTRRVNEIDS